MVKTVGPAVGARGQFGYSEENKWGFPNSPPQHFIEFNSEGIVSDYGSLVSAAIRSDRARHKRRTGAETAGGDVTFELTPEGYGTFIKHALGKKRTKRKDVAFIIVYDGADTNRVITLTNAYIRSVGTTAGDNFEIAVPNGTTVQSLINSIHAATNHSCYAPWGDGTDSATGGYFARALASKGSSAQTLGSADYSTTAYARTAAGVINLEANFNNMSIGSDVDGNSYVFFPVNYKYGIYEHTLDAHPTLPQGLSLEIGRDIAAFNYYGAMVNSMTFTINPTEIITVTANLMCKGGSTVGNPAVVGTNTGWVAPLAGIRYAGAEASAHIEIDLDGTREMFYFDHGVLASEEVIYNFSLERGYYDHDGYYWEVNTVKGFLEFLEYESDYFGVTRKGGVDIDLASTNMQDLNSTSITTLTDTAIYMALNASIKPLVRGNYKGTDAGDSATFYIDITTGGACDGTAAFKGSSDNANWSTATSITSGIWYDILDENDLDTGFDVMWPENVTLVSGDTWSITTFKDEASGPVYQTEESLTGFQGVVTLDKSDGAGSADQSVQGLTVTINNNLYGEKFELGDRQRGNIVPQGRTTEASMNVEFDDLDLFRMFVNGTSGDLNIVVTSDEYINSSSTKFSVAFRLPEIKYSGSTPVVGGEELIAHDMPIDALYDDANNIPDLRITITNGESYI